MHFTHYQITAGKVFAVNPWKHEDIPHDIDDEQDCLKAQTYRENRYDFYKWLSTQPPITADPSIKDGVYKVDDLEIGWHAYSFLTESWFTINHVPNNPRPSAYRQYATLKQPVKQEEKRDIKMQWDNANKDHFTNMTGMQLLNRGCDRENELISLGYVWNRDAHSYISKDNSIAIRQINLLAYDEKEWAQIHK